MNIYKFNIKDFEYQGGDKVSRTAVTVTNSMYYCTANDLNNIAVYLNRIKNLSFWNNCGL